VRHKIEFKANIIYYYGNPAGYIENNKVLIDPIFKSDELYVYVTNKTNAIVEWRDGVFDRLSSGKMVIESGEVKRFRDCRIWQLRSEANPLIKYIGYDELIKIQGKPPDPNDYIITFDFQPDTDNIDEICNKFYENPNSNLVGGKVNLSDIIEIYDYEDSVYNYVDRKGFVEVDFNHQNFILTQTETVLSQ
jgi:hypothetical protein